MIILIEYLQENYDTSGGNSLTSFLISHLDYESDVLLTTATNTLRRAALFAHLSFRTEANRNYSKTLPICLMSLFVVCST